VNPDVVPLVGGFGLGTPAHARLDGYSAAEIPLAPFGRDCRRDPGLTRPFSSREDTDLSSLGWALLAMRVKVAGGLDLDAAAEKVTRSAAMWRGQESSAA
jgi:hypothetical protein